MSTTPKSEFVQHVNHSGHGSATYPTRGHTEPISPHILEPQTASTQPTQSSSHTDRFTILVENLHEHVSRLANAIYSTKNQVQVRLTTIETQLAEIQRKLEESL